MNSREKSVYRFKSFRLDLAERRLLQNGAPVPLTPKAFDMLALLVARAGHLVDKEELMQMIWPDSFVEETNLTRIVHTLRKALGQDDSGNKFIETVSKRGYRFVAEVTIDTDGRLEAPSENGFPSEARIDSIPASPLRPVPMSERRPVVALADWRRESVPAETPALTPRAALTLAKPVIKDRRKYLALAAAAFVLAAVGLSYYFYAGGAKPIDSVAVLPLVNASGDPDTEYLAEGISDSIINSLTRLPSVKVNSLNSVMRFKGKEVNPQAVARELNVRGVLVGRLTRNGDALTISVELIDVSDNSRVWGKQYNAGLSDILAVQGEIARDVSEALSLRLSNVEKKNLAKQHTGNSDAFLHYSLGNYLFRQNTKQAFEQSIKSFEKAIELDPDYALAYTGLARTYQFMGSRAFGPPQGFEQKVEWATLKALQLDETLAEAHALLGVLKFSDFDWVSAEKEMKRALELDPSSSLANSAYFNYLAGIGRANEGLTYAIKGQELNANPNPGELAFAYFIARRYDKAIELYGKALEKRPDNAHPHILLGEAYVAKGMIAEGVAETQKGISLDATLDQTPERWDRYPMMAYAFASAGRRDEALKILDAQLALAERGYVSPYNFAIIYTGLGDKDQAFAWLEKCVAERTRIMAFHFKSRPLFDPLRSDPRYVEILSKMNLTP